MPMPSLKSQPIEISHKQIKELREVLEPTEGAHDTQTKEANDIQIGKLIHYAKGSLSKNFKGANHNVNTATLKVIAHLKEIHSKIEDIQAMIEGLDDRLIDTFNERTYLAQTNNLGPRSQTLTVDILAACKDNALQQSLILTSNTGGKYCLTSHQFFTAWFLSGLPTPVTATKTSRFIKALDIILNGPLPDTEIKMTRRRKNLANQISNYQWFKEQRGQKTDYLIE